MRSFMYVHTISTIMTRCTLARMSMVALIVIGVTTLATPAIASVTLPGGKARFVVAVGTIPTVAGSGSGYSVRLADYTFTAGSTGTVSESFWYWSQGTMSGRSASGVTNSGCEARVCDIGAPTGFEDHTRTDTAPYPKNFTGTYAYDPSTSSVVVTWTDNSIERWTVDYGNDGFQPVARMHIRSTNYGVLEGWAYGSNAAWTTSIDMASIVAMQPSLHGDQYQNDYGTTTIFSSASLAIPATAELCNTNCFSFESQAGSDSSCVYTGADGKQHPGYYRWRFAHTSDFPPRKNAYNIYCEQLNIPQSQQATTQHDDAQTCYNGNYHIRPMLQIIDDDGLFHGWVGVEASLYQAQQGSAYVQVFHFDDL